MVNENRKFRHMNIPKIKLIALAAIVLIGTLFFWWSGEKDQSDFPGSRSQSAPIIKADIPDSDVTRKIPLQKGEKQPQPPTRVKKKRSSTKELQQFASNLEQKYVGLSIREILTKLASDLPDIDRNYLEHLLAFSQDQEIDETLDEMIDDGFMDLSLTGEEFNEEQGAGYLSAATNRMNSAIRVTGLRGNSSAVGSIIDIASHHNADESTLRVCYESLGYLGTQESTDFLKSELTQQTNPFLKSEIILSLSTTGNTDNIDLYLSYLTSQDTDLRNSAIVALGEAQEERAIQPFAKIFSSTEYSSRVLIVQALQKIDTGNARDLLEQISKNYPHLVQSGSDSNNNEVLE